MRILMIAGGKTTPSSRYRVHQFVEPFRKLGHIVDVAIAHPSIGWKSPVPRHWKVPYWLSVYTAKYIRIISRLPLLMKASSYDIVFLHRPLTPSHKELWLETVLRHRNARIVFDFDDAIYLVGKNQKKIENIVASSAWVTVGNTYLGEFARQHNQNVTVIPTVIDTDQYFLASERVPGPIRLGWTGSRDSMRYALPLIRPILVDLSRKVDFEFLVVCDARPTGNWDGVKVRFISWSEKTEVASVQLMDIGLMPLKDAPFERGKCGLKLIQYMGCGIASIASPVGVNSDIVVDGETGFLASTQHEWKEALLRLIEDAALRRRMGQNAHARAREFYSIHAVMPLYQDVFESVMQMPLDSGIGTEEV